MTIEEQKYVNMSINIHNLSIGLNEQIYDAISEVVGRIFAKLSSMLKSEYRTLSFDYKLEEIIKDSFNDDKNKYLNKYDSINMEDIKSNNYENYINKQEEKVKHEDKDIKLLSDKIIEKIDIYLKDINNDSSYYKRNIDKINKSIRDILLKEIEKYFLKTSKINISFKTASEKIYEDIKTNYSVDEKNIGNVEVIKSR